MIKYLENDLEKEMGTGRVLVDFYANWCGPCRMIAPLLEELEDIDIIKVDVDKFPVIAQKHGVISIPSLMIFDDGKMIKNKVGFMSLEELNEFCKK